MSKAVGMTVAFVGPRELRPIIKGVRRQGVIFRGTHLRALMPLSLKTPLKRFVTAAGFLTLSAAPARAQTESFNFDSYCIMGSFQVCASVRLQSIDNVLRMQVWNLNGTMGLAHAITSIGLYHAGSTYDWSGRIQSYSVDYNGTDISGYWTQKNANDIQNLAGVKLELREGTDGNAGIVGCTDPGGLVKWATCWNGGSSFSGQPFVQFTFNLNQHFSMNNVELRWHSQQIGPNDISLKCDTGGAGDYPDCIPNTSVPEPATVILMGTGMAGIIAARRRRKTP